MLYQQHESRATSIVHLLLVDCRVTEIIINTIWFHEYTIWNCGLAIYEDGADNKQQRDNSSNKNSNKKQE